MSEEVELDPRYWLDLLGKANVRAGNLDDSGVEGDYDPEMLGHLLAMEVCSTGRMLFITYRPEWESSAEARQEIEKYIQVMQSATNVLGALKETEKDEKRIDHIGKMIANMSSRLEMFRKMQSYGPDPTRENREEITRMIEALAPRANQSAETGTEMRREARRLPSPKEFRETVTA